MGLMPDIEAPSPLPTDPILRTIVNRPNYVVEEATRAVDLVNPETQAPFLFRRSHNPQKPGTEVLFPVKPQMVINTFVSERGCLVNVEHGLPPDFALAYAPIPLAQGFYWPDGRLAFATITPYIPQKHALHTKTEIPLEAVVQFRTVSDKTRVTSYIME